MANPSKYEMLCPKGHRTRSTFYNKNAKWAQRNWTEHCELGYKVSQASMDCSWCPISSRESTSSSLTYAQGQQEPEASESSDINISGNCFWIWQWAESILWLAISEEGRSKNWSACKGKRRQIDTESRCLSLTSRTKAIHLNFFKINFIWKLELKRATFHPLTDSLFGCNSQNWTCLKLLVRSFFWVSFMGAGAQRLESSSSAFPSTLVRSWIWSGTDRIWDISTVSGTLLATLHC